MRLRIASRVIWLQSSSIRGLTAPWIIQYTRVISVKLSKVTFSVQCSFINIWKTLRNSQSRSVCDYDLWHFGPKVTATPWCVKPGLASLNDIASASVWKIIVRLASVDKGLLWPFWLIYLLCVHTNDNWIKRAIITEISAYSQLSLITMFWLQRVKSKVTKYQNQEAWNQPGVPACIDVKTFQKRK